MQCLLCNRQFKPRLTIRELLWPAAIDWPRVCTSCRSSFAPITGPTCPVCFAPQTTTVICRECRYWRTHYRWQLVHTALYRYNDAMKDYMHRYKFNGDYRLRFVFQSAMTTTIADSAAELVVPIPVTEQTMHSRGFNQVEGFLTDVSLTHCLTAKHRQKVAQSKKNRHERLTTPQPFKLVNPAQVTGKRVLLVDDVYTTGRTLYHAADLVYHAGAASVVSLSLAR